MSNRVVTYIDINLNSVEEYWSSLIVASVQKFRTDPSAPALFHAATDLWHLHDWVWHEENPGQNSQGPAFNSYRLDLLAACPELGWLRDIADAKKHRGLGRLPEVQGAKPDWVLNVGLFVAAAAPGHALKFFLVLNDGSKQDADQILRTAVAFWRSRLSDKDLASP